MDIQKIILHPEWWMGLLEYLRRVFMVSSVRTVLLTGIPYVLINVFAFAFLRRLRIQKEPASARQTRSELLYFALNFFIFHTMVVVPVFFLQRFGVFKYYTDNPGWYIILAQMTFMFLFNDTYFYWVHRFMHGRRVFKYAHAVHHRSTNPTSITAYSFHPWESILLSFYIAVLFAVSGVLFGGLHIQAFMGFMLLTSVHNVYIHAGIEFLPKGFARNFFSGWLITSVHHNMHHHLNHGNFGLYFTFWDRICGTTTPNYIENFEKIREPVARAGEAS